LLPNETYYVENIKSTNFIVERSALIYIGRQTFMTKYTKDETQRDMGAGKKFNNKYTIDTQHVFMKHRLFITISALMYLLM
jgi:hypothetical protein